MGRWSGEEGDLWPLRTLFLLSAAGAAEQEERAQRPKIALFAGPSAHGLILAAGVAECWFLRDTLPFRAETVRPCDTMAACARKNAWASSSRSSPPAAPSAWPRSPPSWACPPHPSAATCS